jgi:hypothetical protein
MYGKLPRGDVQDARASPLPPPCVSPPPSHVHPPPPQPERLVMRKDEAVGNKKKMQVCLPNNLLTVEPRAVDPNCFDADPDSDPAQNLDADPDPDPGGGGGGGRSAKNVHPSWQNPRYAPDGKHLNISQLRMLINFSHFFYCTNAAVNYKIPYFSPGGFLRYH